MYVKYVCQFEEKDWNFSSARKCSDVYSSHVFILQQVVDEYYPQEI